MQTEPKSAKGFVCDSANLFCVWLSKIQALELRTGSQKCTCKEANIVLGSYERKNKRTENLPIGTSHIAIAHLCNQFNYVFALVISMLLYRVLPDATFQKH